MPFLLNLCFLCPFLSVTKSKAFCPWPLQNEPMSRTTVNVRWHRILKFVMLIRGRGRGLSPRVGPDIWQVLRMDFFPILNKPLPILPRNERTAIRHVQISTTTNPMDSGQRSTREKVRSVAKPGKVCEVLLIWKRRFLIRFVQHHSRWNVKLSWDFFLGRRGLGVFFECFADWFQERFANKRRFSTSGKSMHWFLGVLCRMLSEDKAKHMIVSEMASSSYTNSANSFITEPFVGHAHVVLGKRQLPLRRFPSARFKSWPRFLGNLWIKEIVWYYHRSCMPKTLQWSKAIQVFFWREHMIKRMCGSALHFPMLGFESGLERKNG